MNRTGFSLTEALVALGVLGVASIGTLRVLEVNQFARNTEVAKRDRRQLESVLAQTLQDSGECEKAFRTKDANTPPGKSPQVRLVDTSVLTAGGRFRSLNVRSLQLQSREIDPAQGTHLVTAQIVTASQGVSGGDVPTRMEFPARVNAEGKIQRCLIGNPLPRIAGKTCPAGSYVSGYKMITPTGSTPYLDLECSAMGSQQLPPIECPTGSYLANPGGERKCREFPVSDGSPILSSSLTATMRGKTGVAVLEVAGLDWALLSGSTPTGFSHQEGWAGAGGGSNRWQFQNSTVEKFIGIPPAAKYVVLELNVVFTKNYNTGFSARFESGIPCRPQTKNFSVSLDYPDRTIPAEPGRVLTYSDFGAPPYVFVPERIQPGLSRQLFSTGELYAEATSASLTLSATDGFLPGYAGVSGGNPGPYPPQFIPDGINYTVEMTLHFCKEKSSTGPCGRIP